MASRASLVELETTELDLRFAGSLKDKLCLVKRDA